ncbi:MAG: hypothetical protein A3F73_11220 [Gallionellales bacterium RIFCSPLOWO2_12_FULL_59_22]|nr:MAG: hypothetical protein A3H99_10935 [Gallionellales bacterium RIFCSPLOWO2_02_FULL_59_110]OGT04669.1 MAG: hypothetical protein A2Z65_05150 [Gallionellales bacterium RIFCSPLOWO2_02_58_13]OGT11850.1 MAG: hypothetical protein A3F73_11220 [Gallionellales bacterium RIFCSPLOWO2_12_FULL_59_22]
MQKPDGTTQAFAADGTITTTSVAGPDPRFGMQAPFTTSTTVKTPSGLTNSMRAAPGFTSFTLNCASGFLDG